LLRPTTDVLTEHVDLRRRGQDLENSADLDADTLRELGERLERHIRFEERLLFPMIEEALPPDELERLRAAIERAETEDD
jgi:hemerythrin-like domain-containing protein